ncbi:MAG: hypothetical protein K2P78_00010 [Gemmataceae bacterium]|nr:hypothetical protein [Gemmataceae bacterium]
MSRSVRARVGVERLEARETPALIGTLDPSFGTGGAVVSDFGQNDTAAAVVLQPDGKLVVAGTTAPAVGGSSFLVARYNPNGTLDTTFGGGTGKATVSFLGFDQAAAVALTPDGKIVVVGTTVTNGAPPADADIAVARLNADGTLDTTFDTDGKQTVNFTTTDEGTGVAVRPDGRVLVVGSTGGAGSDFAAAQLTTAGALDNAFDTDGKATYDFGGADLAAAVTLLPDGRAVLVGSTTVGVNPANFAVLRVTTAGAADTTFDTDGKQTTDFGFDDRATSVVLQADGKTVVAGYAGGTADDFAVARLATDGALDTTFNTTGKLTITFGGVDRANAVGIQPDGKIVLAGETSFNGGDVALLRVYPNGFLDTTFGVNGQRTVTAGANDTGRGLVILPNGRLVVAGAAGAAGAADVALTRVIGTVEEGRNLTVGGTLNGAAVGYAPLGTGIYALSPAFSTAPFAGFAGNVRTAVADVNGDGVQDTVVASGPGITARFAVISGKDNLTVLVAPTAPFAGSEDFAAGLFVSAADVDQDGRAEIIISPDQGGGPRVTAFSLLPGGLFTRANFFGIDDPNFRGGARTAVGDVNGDGTPDVAVQAGFLGGPRAALFNGRTLFATPTRLVNDFFAFPGTDAVTLRNGAYVAAGDVNGDGFADLIFGGGPGGAPRVFVLSGQLVTAGNIQGAYDAPVANFFVAGNATDRGGIRVAATDVDFDTKADVAVGTGQNVVSRVRVYFGNRFTSPAEPTSPQDLDPFGGAVLADGVYVG